MSKSLRKGKLVTLVLLMLCISIFPVEVLASDGVETSEVTFLPQSMESGWGLETIRAPQVWEKSKGEGVVVAVIDSGVDFSNELLKENKWHNKKEVPDEKDNDGNGYVDDLSGYSFSDEEGPLYYHGTFVAGVVAKTAPKVKVMDLHLLHSGGYFFATEWKKLIEAIDYAIDNGADVINLSLYFRVDPPSEFYRVVKRAYRANIPIVSIAGNNNKKVSNFKDHKGMIVVAAVNRDLKKASFSNYGKVVDVFAPGEEVVSVNPDGEYVIDSGTSLSAGYVSGVIALLLSSSPDLTVPEVKESISRTARKLEGKKIDLKLIDAGELLQKKSQS
ncbi:MAG: S8 family serine peptidase [Candidatus Paceibacterota bacterium]